MQKQFSVKFDNPKAHKAHNVNGYLGNTFGNGLVSHYTRGEAIKKASAFNGKIEPVKSTIELGELKLTMLSEMQLVFPIDELLQDKPKAAVKGNDEVFYFANVFDEIRMENPHLSEKATNQLSELIQLMYEYDYFLLVDINRPKSLM